MAKVVPFAGGVHLSIRAFADETSMDRATVVKRLTSANIQPSGKRGGHPVYRLKDLLHASVMTTEDGSLDPDKLKPFERHAFYKAEREKLQLQVEQGELLSSLHVEQRFASVFKVVAEALDTLPDVLERDCGAAPLLLAKIEQRLDAARDELYARLTEHTEDDVHVDAQAG